MSDTYWKVGTSYRTSFDYVLSSGPVTGLTQAAFTIELSKNGVGNQATTGITIAEVDATNNKGEYAILVSGITGFTAAVGTYDLVIYRTANTLDRWTETVRITTDGTSGGSYGAVSFTATANNGRVMSAGSPLSGASVRIVTPASNLMAATLSDASGLWGPIYFDTDGTYPVYIQKSGYTTATGSIVISGGATIATGPGSDFSITATSASTGLTASSLWAYAKRVMRDRSGTTADLLAQQIVDDALTMISQEREWPWFHTTSTITFQPTYTAGTIAINVNASTVTLTSGTFPTWAASADLYVNGQWYPVLTRDSDTQLTLAQAWGNASITGSTYALAQCSYLLPSDLQSLDKVLFDRTWAYNPQAVSYPMLLTARASMQFGQARPNMWAIVKDKFVIWPLPTDTATAEILYYRRPALLVGANDNADWDPLHLALLRRAIEFQASLRAEVVTGSVQDCLALYKSAFDKASSWDKSATDREVSDVGNWTDANWWRGNIVTGP